MLSKLRKCLLFFFISSALFAQAEGPYTGDPFWRQAPGGHILSLPSVQVQSAVVALDGGNIRAYSTKGTPMWNYAARGRICPFVTRAREGTSYFARTNGILIAINRSGRELWRRNIGGPLTAHVIPGWDGRLFVPMDKKIACYTAAGTLLWTKTFETPFFLAPKLDRSGGIFLALENNEVHRIDAFGNTKIWTINIKPAVMLPIEEQQLLVLYMDGSLGVLGISEDWFMSAQGEIRSYVLPRLPARPIAAASRGNIAAILFEDGKTALYSHSETGIIWTGDSHIRELIKSGGKPEPEAEVIYDERGIYILSKDGATGFSHNGDRRWYTFLKNTAAIPAFGNDGVLYSGGKDWILYAYKMEDRVLTERTSLYGPVPEGAYGTGSPKQALLQNYPINEYEMRYKLDQINRGIQAGKVGGDELEWTSTLMTVATDQSLIRYKLEAIMMLGQIGSQETVPWLVNLFRRDNDVSIRVAVANAIGAIGVDPEGVAIQTFAFMLVNGSGIKDEQVLMALTTTIGSLCRFSGPPLSESGIKVLTLLTAQNQPPAVIRQAKREIAQLK